MADSDVPIWGVSRLQLVVNVDAQDPNPLNAQAATAGQAGGQVVGAEAQ
ncbi:MULTISPECIES: hypothetical protein [Streptomyces]|nr:MULTISPECIES: hypothetical protein [Streptomyces]MYS89849.1 hypothetical protein [Streptomyces sp. SID5464]